MIFDLGFGPEPAYGNCGTIQHHPLGNDLLDPSMLSHGPSVMNPVSHLHSLGLSQSPKVCACWGTDSHKLNKQTSNKKLPQIVLWYCKLWMWCGFYMKNCF